MAIATVSVEGESGLRIEDQSLAKPFLSDIAIQRLVLTDLATSATAAPATIDLAALLDQRAPLTVKGTMTPFAKALGVDSTVSLKNYPLSRLSPYVIQSVGLALTGGWAAHMGGASVWRGALRVSFWGTLALVASSAIGRLFPLAGGGG